MKVDDGRNKKYGRTKRHCPLLECLVEREIVIKGDDEGWINQELSFNMQVVWYSG